jgi:hypothetical protein
MMKKPLVKRVRSAYGNAEIATAEIEMAAEFGGLYAKPAAGAVQWSFEIGRV